MRLIEFITIYLAVGAPFGVSFFLREQDSGLCASLYLKSMGAAFLWPLSCASRVLTRRRVSKPSSNVEGLRFNEEDEEKIERGKREMLGALQKLLELSGCGLERREMERISCVIRESIEKYAGLRLSAGGGEEDAPPSKREMELCRVAGRRGDDLLLAGRCIHRRNVARLISHRERARNELLHGLAEVRELSASGSPSLTEPDASRHLSVAILRLYGHAFNLLSLLEDEAAARSVARLLDVECSRLRRLEALELNGADERGRGDELCKPHIHPLAFTGPSQNRRLTRG